MRTAAVVTALVLAMAARAATGRAAQVLTFHGLLRDAVGAPLTQPAGLSFRIYDAPAGGHLLAGPFPPLQLEAAGDAIWAVFGPVPDGALAGDAHWLEVSVGPTPQLRVQMEAVFYDAADDRGQLSGGRTLELRPALDATLARFPTAVTTVLDNGPPSRRIDLVFVGDGYTEADLAAYAAHVEHALNELLAQEPYATYRSFFNAHRVDVLSNESGVDNDPVQGIERDTALDMAFWCGGLDRLLCVDVVKAYAFAATAPQTDHVLAVANSTLYGGGGYTLSDLATFSGGNSYSAGIAIHELGHSLGNLADEYYYAQGSRYTGPEPVQRNVSILAWPGMVATGTKWALWLGDAGVGFDGPVSTFEGASYGQFGLFRPTANSMMRSLGRPFNPPSAESLVLEFYGLVAPIDTAGVVGGGPPDQSSVVYVDPVDPVGHALDVQWFVDGSAVPAATQDSLQVAPLVGLLGLSPGGHVLSVRVTDNTALVRDEAARAARMTATRSWALDIAPSTAVADRGTGAAQDSARLWISPSPFREGTTLHYWLPTPSHVRVTVYNVAGRKVTTLRDRVEAAGPHEASFAARGRPAGLYVFRLTSDCGDVTRKAMLLR